MGEFSAPTPRCTARISAPSLRRPWPRCAATWKSAYWKKAGEPVGFFPFQRSPAERSSAGGRQDVGFSGRDRPQRGRVGPAGASSRLPTLGVALRSSDRIAVAAAAVSLERGDRRRIWICRGAGKVTSEQKAHHRDSFKRADGQAALRHARGRAAAHRSHSADPTAFQLLVKWKTAQYGRTGVTNVLGFDWTVALLRAGAGRARRGFLRHDVGAVHRRHGGGGAVVDAILSTWCTLGSPPIGRNLHSFRRG